MCLHATHAHAARARLLSQWSRPRTAAKLAMLPTWLPSGVSCSSLDNCWDPPDLMSHCQVTSSRPQRQGRALFLVLPAKELSRCGSHCPTGQWPWQELHGDHSTLVGWHRWGRALHLASGTTAAASRHKHALCESAHNMGAAQVNCAGPHSSCPRHRSPACSHAC